MDEIRQRVQRANSTATLETTLGYRRSKAIASLNDNLPIFSVINILTEIGKYELFNYFYYKV